MSEANKDQAYRAYYYSAPGRVPSRQPVDQPPKKKRKTSRFLGFVVVIVLVAVAVYIFTGKHSSANAVAATHHKSSSRPADSQPHESGGLPPATLDNMAQTINSVIEQDSGINTSVNLIDLNGGQSEHYGVNQTFQAASTAKIITAEYFLHEVEEGQQSLSETINGNTAEYELQQMIVVSDDNAWAALNNTLGYNNLQNYADQTFGISDYQAYNNSLSSRDIALALQKLWQGSTLNASDRALLLGYLKIANYREYIVPAIPAEDTIYHKIGLYEDYVNDAAIVTHNNQAFVLVIFTNGNGQYDWPARAQMMQQIAKAALKAYFNQ